MLVIVVVVVVVVVVVIVVVVVVVVIIIANGGGGCGSNHIKRSLEHESLKKEKRNDTVDITTLSFFLPRT